MDLLSANDPPRAYPNSWYAATSDLPSARPSLQGAVQADVCVVGAGFTGLSAALHLAQAGRDVVLIDAQRVGFGASGRNGGQLGSGQRVEQPYLEKMFGRDDARKLWELGEDAKQLVKQLVSDHQIDCFLRPGVAWSGSSQSDVDALHAYADHMGQHYDYALQKLDYAQMAALCPSPDYRGGILDQGAGHLHPLRFVLGLAQAAQSAGVRIFEGTRALDVSNGVRTETGHIQAEQIILAGNGYLGQLAPKVAARVMPINNFVAATEPLGAEARRILTQDIALADSRFVVNYFRLSHDGRLLFGGGESYGYRFPKDIAAKVRGPMSQIFPHLKDVKIDYAWGGTLAITMKRLPYLTRVAPNTLSASGYSGHGVGTAIHAGKLMAQVLLGQSDGFDTMARIPTSMFPGGTTMRTPLLSLAMTWYALRDRIGI